MTIPAKNQRSESPEKPDPEGLMDGIENMDPEAEARVLRKTRASAKRRYGFTDKQLDRLYGVESRPKY